MATLPDTVSRRQTVQPTDGPSVAATTENRADMVERAHGITRSDTSLIQVSPYLIPWRMNQLR